MTSLLRPRLAAAVAAPCRLRVRRFSAARPRRSGQFTLAIPPSASKKSVLAALQTRPVSPAGGGPDNKDNAAVVLASPEFATWLEDETFMQGLLLHGLPSLAFADADINANAPEGVRVLAAVVAALAPPPAASSSSSSNKAPPPLSGLSVVYGNAARLLPHMQPPDSAGKTALPSSSSSSSSSRGSIGSDLDKDAAITVQVPPLRSASSSASSSADSLSVTLPLANTVFQNGRRSTLLASQWHWQADTLRLTALASHEHDVVVPSYPSGSGSGSSFTTVSALLFPLAEPLTIAAGLGNIVRQVVDPATRKPVPAARELEAAIPALLAARRRSNPAPLQQQQQQQQLQQDGPMAVWALVVPAPLVPFYTQLKQQARPALDAVSNDAVSAADAHSADAEQQAAARTADHVTALLAAGCRLHRVLSGGGGWGLKQGLLSLDPQMSHPAAAPSISQKGSGDGTSRILGEERSDDEMDDEAMQSFIRSFRSETEAGAEAESPADGVAMPGAVVQFFVAPLAGKDAGGTDTATRTAPSNAFSITLGAQAGDDGSNAPAAGDNDGTAAPTLFPNHFGAVSNHGIFLASDTAPMAIRTKLDAPGTYVVYEGRS